MDLGFEVDQHGDYTVLAVRGEVDVYTAPRLRERLIELVSQGSHQVVVDLEGFPIRRPWTIVHLRRRQLPTAVAQFIEFLRAGEWGPGSSADSAQQLRR